MPLVVQSEPPIEKAIEAISGLEASGSNIKRVQRLWRKKLASVLKREAIPAMQQVTPKRSGQAAKSLRIKTISNPFGLEVGPGRKGFYLAFHPDAEELAQRYHGILQDVYTRHASNLLNEAIQETYGL